MNEQEIQEKLKEFEMSENFEYLIAGYENDYFLNGKDIPSKEELRKEVLCDYERQLINEEQCEAEGHKWEETDLDAENGRNDLECQRCGQTEHIQW